MDTNLKKIIKKKLHGYFNKKIIKENRMINKLLNGDTDSIIIDYNTAHAELGIELLSDDEPSIHIIEIWSDIKGKGDGTKLLEKLKKYSIKSGIPLSLRASISNNIQTRGGLNQNDLINWYIKNGFTISEDDNNFETDPSAPFMVFNH